MDERQFPLPANFAALKSSLEAAGQTVTLPSGVLRDAGVEIAYRIDGQTIYAAIQKKPMFVPVAMVWSKVADWLGA